MLQGINFNGYKLKYSFLIFDSDKNPVLYFSSSIGLNKKSEKMRIGLLLMIFVLIGFPLFAQKHELTTEFETIIFSRHLWRGSQFGDALTIEPSLTFSKGDYSFNFWAAKTINDSYAEVDLIFSRTFSNLTVTFFDYYNPVRGETNRYFSVEKGKNRHSGELTINYGANPKLPLNVMLGSFFYGDNNPKTDKPFFSTYVEFSYPVSLKTFEIEPVLGLTTHKGYYAGQFALLNTGFVCRKDFSLKGNWLIPTLFTGIYNPNLNEFYFNIAVGIRLE